MISLDDQDPRLVEGVDPFWQGINDAFFKIWSQRPFSVVAGEEVGELVIYTKSLMKLTKDTNGDDFYGDFSYIFRLNEERQKMTVHRSSFKFFYLNGDEPLFRYEFNRENETTPRSYLLVTPSQNGSLGSIRSRVRGVETMQFPLGGDILRPCLEDIILGLDNSFSMGISTSDRVILKKRIDRFRENQQEGIINHKGSQA